MTNAARPALRRPCTPPDSPAGPAWPIGTGLDVIPDKGRVLVHAISGKLRRRRRILFAIYTVSSA